MDIIFGLVVGLSLAAACGFRVFVPMLVLSVSAKLGFVELAHGWDWLASWPALIAFSAATITEIAAYYVPWIDNALDSLATPAAVVAGAISTAACLADVHPLLQWSAAIVAGGGFAGLVQSATVLVRGASTATTGGLANFLVATGELIMSVVLAVLAVVAPLLAGVVICVLATVIVRRFWRRKAANQDQAPSPA